MFIVSLMDSTNIDVIGWCCELPLLRFKTLVKHLAAQSFRNKGKRFELPFSMSNSMIEAQ